MHVIFSEIVDLTVRLTISGLKGEIRLVCSSFPGERLLVSTSDLQSQRISHVLSVSVGFGHLTCEIQVVSV